MPPSFFQATSWRTRKYVSFLTRLQNRFEIRILVKKRSACAWKGDARSGDSVSGKKMFRDKEEKRYSERISQGLQLQIRVAAGSCTGRPVNMKR
jgi:hypothetical protein